MSGFVPSAPLPGSSLPSLRRMALSVSGRWFLPLLAWAAAMGLSAPAAARVTEEELRGTCENRSGGSLAQMRLDACNQLLHDGNYGAPQRARILVNRAWVLDQVGRKQEAFADYDEAIRLAPDWAIGHSERGFALLRAGQSSAAIASYDRALALDSHIAYALYGRGIARLRQKQKLEGEQDIAAARGLMQGVDQVFARFNVRP